MSHSLNFSKGVIRGIIYRFTVQGLGSKLLKGGYIREFYGGVLQGLAMGMLGAETIAHVILRCTDVILSCPNAYTAALLPVYKHNAFGFRGFTVLDWLWMLT